MSICKEKFGELNGEAVYQYTMKNKDLEVQILSYGGIIRTLKYRGTDITLGRDSLEEYLSNAGYLGALIGRNGNRIENSEFTLNGKTYKLAANEGRNNLHGGNVGFDSKIWEVEEKGENALMLSLISPDGEEGFPGEVRVTVTYTLTEGNGLQIKYEGQTDSDTVLNMTNHAYFNLNGHNSGSTENHRLKLSCSFFTPNNEECMPTGEILSVVGTPLDFTEEKRLGDGFSKEYIQTAMVDGIDHNFVIDGVGMRHAASFTGDKTGIVMDVYTDSPGIQIYTGNAIEQGGAYKEGVDYPVHGGVCFETQKFPNAMKYSHFPSTVLRKGENYLTVTEYRFSK